MKKINVLVTAAGSACSINIIKSLKMVKKYKIFSADIYYNSVGAFRSYKGFIINKENNNKKYVNDLLKICVAEKIKILIPGFDTELEVLKNNENKFKKIGTLIIVGSKRLIEIANNKFELSNWLKENKFDYLKTYRLEDRKKIKSHLKFPFIIKPNSGTGQTGFDIIHNQRQYLALLEKLKFTNENFIAQQYLNENLDEFTATVSVGKNFEILGCNCSKRIISKGTSRVITYDNYDSVKKELIKIAKKIKSFGPINFQFKIKKKKIYIFEINARFSTTNYVRALVGYNEVDLIITHLLTGKSIPLKNPQKITALAYLEYSIIKTSEILSFKKKGVTKKNSILFNYL